MDIEVADRSRMAILLLEKCNFDCPHCLRIDEPMARGYQLSFRQLESCLVDCRHLDSVAWFHFTGGEPTLWHEGVLDLVHLLVAVAKAGFVPSFTTNGSTFEEYEDCRRFFCRYLERSGTRLIVYLSVDTFHGNFDTANGRAPSLDSLARLRDELPRAKADLIDARIVATVSRDPASLLPDEMVRHYELLGLAFTFGPLAPKGRARMHLTHLCPDIRSGDPDALGAYGRFRKRHADAPRADATPAAETATALALIGDDYFFHIPSPDPRLPDTWRKVAPLGALPADVIQAYSCPEYT